MKFESELSHDEICQILDTVEYNWVLRLYDILKFVLVVKEDVDGSRWISVDDLLEKAGK